MSLVGVCQCMTNKNFESISALLDDEMKAQEFEGTYKELSESSEQVEAFSRYSLIGDVLRKEQELVTDNSFANAIQQAIANTEQESVETDQVVSISAHPSWGQRVAARVRGFSQSSTGRGMSQFAIAASVALVAVVGVGNMQNTAEQPETSPAVIAPPLIGSVAPVSLSADRPASKQSANQKTQSRINSLISDHQQQLRVADDKNDDEQGSEKDKKDID